VRVDFTVATPPRMSTGYRKIILKIGKENELQRLVQKEILIIASTRIRHKKS